MSLYDDIGPVQAMHYIGFIAAKIATGRTDAHLTAAQLLPVLHPDVPDHPEFGARLADLVNAASRGETDEAALRFLAYGPSEVTA